MTNISLFPQPQTLNRREGHFTLNRHSRIFCADKALGEMLASYLRPATGFDLPAHPLNAEIRADATNAILLLPDGKDADESIPTAHYSRAGGVERRARRLASRHADAAPAAAAGDHGKRETSGYRLATAGAGHRRFAPAFPWRGLHLDVCRHFFPLDFIKRYLDLMAFYKLNTFHWHLTDDQGWRIKIEQYPRLTEVGAWRAESPILGYRDRFDGQPYGGFYTKAEIRDILAYAAARGITVVPEIEMPGHAVAALAAYPELGCRGEGYSVRTTWGIAEDIYCAGKDEVFVFLRNVLEEVLDLFPSEYIHIGGDEAPKTRWAACPACQARIREQGLADEYELQSWFVSQIERWLNQRGRKLVGWDEILEGGLADNATVMSWRGSDGGIAAASAGHDVIMSPNTYCYLDYYQSHDRDSEPPAISSTLPLERVWQFEVVPAGIPADKRRHILGGQGNLWTEYIPTTSQAEYMAYPRAIAIADVLWNHPERRDYADLLARLRKHLPHLDALNVNYRPLDA